MTGSPVVRQWPLFKESQPAPDLLGAKVLLKAIRGSVSCVYDSMTLEVEMDFNRYRTVKQFAATEPWSEHAVRWWILKNVDGFDDRCVLRVGRRVFIDLIEAERWLCERLGPVQLCLFD